MYSDDRSKSFFRPKRSTGLFVFSCHVKMRKHLMSRSFGTVIHSKVSCSKETHLLYVHVDISHRLVGVKAHHSGFDGDGRFAVGRRDCYSRLFITSQAILQTSGWHAATRAADSLVVRTKRVEAVLTRAGFPHVFCKVAARWHLWFAKLGLVRSGCWVIWQIQDEHSWLARHKMLITRCYM